MSNTPTDNRQHHTSPNARGSFGGVEVRTGVAGGLSSAAPAVAGESTHFHAAQIPQLGDVVLAVRRHFDPATSAATQLELRAFAATAPGRGALADMPGETLLEAPGALAFAALALSAGGDAADERRPARLIRCAVTDAAATDDAARGVADWLRTTWESELLFGSWPAVRGRLSAFATTPGGAPAQWARDWLEQSEHHVGTDPDPQFLKVLAEAWLERSDDAADQTRSADED